MLLENIRDTDVRVALIQALIPEGLKAVNENYRKKSGIWREKAPARQGKRALGQARRLGISYGPENTDRSAAGPE